MSDQAEPRPLLSGGPAATERIGAVLGAALRAGHLVDVEGPLGAGKTCLVRGMVAGAGGDPAAVRSPTFVLHQPHLCQALQVHHVDLYRLGPGADIDFLDLEALLETGAALIEWGQYADLREHSPTRIEIEVGDGERRRLRLGGNVEPLRESWATLVAEAPA